MDDVEQAFVSLSCPAEICWHGSGEMETLTLRPAGSIIAKTQGHYDERRKRVAAWLFRGAAVAVVVGFAAAVAITLPSGTETETEIAFDGTVNGRGTGSPAVGAFSAPRPDQQTHSTSIFGTYQPGLGTTPATDGAGNPLPDDIRAKLFPTTTSTTLTVPVPVSVSDVPAVDTPVTVGIPADTWTPPASTTPAEPEPAPADTWTPPLTTEPPPVTWTPPATTEAPPVTWTPPPTTAPPATAPVTAAPTTSQPPRNIAVAANRDAMVRSGGDTKNNFASSPALELGEAWNMQRKSYVNFPLNTVGSPSVRSAKLRVYAFAPGGATVSAAGASSTWSESSITWHNAPPAAAAAASAGLARNQAAWVEIDVTAWVNNRLASGSGNATFMLTANAEAWGLSMENTAGMPPALAIVT